MQRDSQYIPSNKRYKGIIDVFVKVPKDMTTDSDFYHYGMAI